MIESRQSYSKENRVQFFWPTLYSDSYSQTLMQIYYGNVSIIQAVHKMMLPNATMEATNSLIFQWVFFARSHKWTELTLCCSWSILPMLSMTTVARRHLSTSGIWASIRCCAVVVSQPVRSQSLWRWTDSGLQNTAVLFQPGYVSLYITQLKWQ